MAVNNISSPRPMMWFYPLLFVGFAVLTFLYRRAPLSSPGAGDSLSGNEIPKSIYHISVKDIRGSDVSLSTFRGKVLLIVNVASKCGLTQSNYLEMNLLYERYKSQGLEILAFPCNQFGGQEPGSSNDIQETCSIFRVEFPIFDKVEVNGKNATVLYKFLKAQKGGIFGDGIKWNFTKFLVDRNGMVVKRYAPTSSPLSIEEDIKRILGLS